MSEAINVVATLKVKPELIEAGKPVIMKLVQMTKQEKGVQRYDLYYDENEAGVHVLVERYENLQAFKKHQESAHFKEAMQKSKEFLSCPIQIRVLKQALPKEYYKE